MSRAATALVCTGDPLLDMLLQSCRAFAVLPAVCETVDDAIREAAANRPTFLFTGVALGDVRRLATQAAGARVCCLVDGETPVDPSRLGCEVLTAERITAELIDGWARPGGKPAAGATAQFPLPATQPVLPGPVEQTPLASRLFGRQGAAPPSSGQPGGTQVHHSASQQAPVVLRQQIVTLWGAKPGAGRSTLAVGISELLSRMGSVRVCTVDLNPFNSSIAALLGKEQEVPSWFHLSEGLSRGTLPVQEALRWIQPNWAILSGPGGRDEWTGWLDESVISALVDGLRREFDYIILDPECRSGPVSEAALRIAQTVLVTVGPDYPGILDTARALESLAERGILERSRCRLVLSKWVETPYLPGGEVATCLGMPVSARVPDGAEAVVSAAGQGIPITRWTAPNAKPVADGIATVAQVIAESVAGGSGTGRALGSQLRNWFSRS